MQMIKRMPEEEVAQWQRALDEHVSCCLANALKYCSNCMQLDPHLYIGEFGFNCDPF